MKSKQPDLFSYQKRVEELKRMKSPLDRFSVIDWEIFRPILSKIVKKKEGQAGRTPYDVILKFKILILQRLYDLSDEQMEYQIKDRFSFMNFLGLTIHDSVPDANTIRVFREELIQHGIIEELFDRFNEELSAQGFLPKKGAIIDASIVEVPKQRNSRKENAMVKSGEIPKDWQDKPNKLAQKDTDARWVKKGCKNYFGYKNHIIVNNKTKLIEKYTTSSAEVHDSQKAVELIEQIPGGQSLYGDSAYNTPEVQKALEKKNMKHKINRKGKRNHPLSATDKEYNKKISKTRARVEHAFARIAQFRGGFIRTIGKERADFQIGLSNLVHNFSRFAFLAG